jgi:glutamine---fructose-6-phosphate transaminase (isomerizing)
MCGIIGYCGPRKAADILIEGLKRLEYRGYDSAGIAIVDDSKLTVLKRKGKIQELRNLVPQGLPGNFGIGHTRWATHGGVTDANAHPHTDSSGKIAVVHNGIIENYLSLKEKLMAEGIEFKSETDSEVIAHLIGYYYEGDLEKAVKSALCVLKGTYGIAVIHADESSKVIGARNGSPLVLGIGDGETFLASDVTAIIAHTKQVVYIEDGEIVTITPQSFRTTDQNDRPVDKKIDKIAFELQAIEKNGFSTFMEKEIFEQPESIRRAITGRIDQENATAKLGGLNLTRKDLLNIERIRIIAAGTSFHAALIGTYLLESIARLPSVAELASEVRYRNPIVEPTALYFAVSQSGETADTLYALRELQRKGATVLGICNVVGSTIARESDGGTYIHGGPEIAVASTKAFTSQIAVFYLLTLMLGRIRDLSRSAGEKLIAALLEVPVKVQRVLMKKTEIQTIAKKYCRSRDFLYLGRGLSYPVALEGALKLKEISYIHAEGYSAAEIKHGPIALVNEETPSFFIAPDDSLREKTISNMKEVKARGGAIITVCTEGDDEIAGISDDVITIPRIDEMFYPFLTVVPTQLFAFFCALELGRDVDQPRNLAKSVTVE